MKRLSGLILLLGWPGAAQAVPPLGGGDYVITKQLAFAPGSAEVAVGDYVLAFAWGEQTSGPVLTEGNTELFPGYFGGGRLGGGLTIQVLATRVAPGRRVFLQESLQVGVPLDARIEIDFSDQIDRSSVELGVEIYQMIDHNGQETRQRVEFKWASNDDLETLTLTPHTTWSGNTLYEIVINTAIRSVTGYNGEDETHIFFHTLLDPQIANTVRHPFVMPGAEGSAASLQGRLGVSIPESALAGQAVLLSSKDPIATPLRVDPAIIHEANQKAQAASAYRIPLALREIVALDPNGEPLPKLGRYMQLSLNRGALNSAESAQAALYRPETFSIWALDTEHRTWVKLPGSRLNPDGSVTAAVGQMSVFALMASPDGSAADAYAYPNPWRPHGPNAGEGPGQTGSEAGGITFTNLPSECRILIYTLAGEKVRELSHSDLAASVPGTERWDVKNSGGESVASGVYLWRIESSVDGKNGKLIIIR